MDARELKDLKHRRTVVEASLDIPDGVIETHRRKLLDEVRAMSSEYAGPVPVGDRGLYKAWALKREAFELRVVHVLYRRLERG